jgi:glyoxylase-like metal-dependent hydrolase (beta-lactamase superfamily II)
MRITSRRRHISRSGWAGGSASGNISARSRSSSDRSSTRGAAFARDGSQFDHQFVDGEVFGIGRLEVRVMHTPGHTPACVTFVVGDAAFVGDTLFMPDYGTARADFPGGDAHVLFRSIRKVLSLAPETRLFLCHDYKAPRARGVSLGDDRGGRTRRQRPCPRRRHRG